MNRSDIFARILRATILVIGILAIYLQVSVFTNRTFHDLLYFLWIPLVLIGILLVRGKSSAKDEPDGLESVPQYRRPQILFPGLFSIVGFLLWRIGHPIAAAIYGSAVIFTLAVIGDRFKACTVSKEKELQTKDVVAVTIIVLASMIVALCEHRVNWDDAKYLHNVANALEHPDEPLLVYENLHGVKGLKIYHPTVQLQTYEIFVAMISKISTIDHVLVYYLILPPIWAALAVIAQWTLLRRLAGPHAALALIATFIILTAWGGHRSYGAFAFDFVGRGIFVAFAIPALISSALDFVEKRSLCNWKYLFLATWTGCFLTSSAYAIAPFAVILVLIASYGFSWSKVPDFLLGFLAVVWCPILLGYLTWIAPVVVPLDVDHAGNAHTVFAAAQGKIAVILFALAPFLALIARWQSAQWLLRYTGLAVIILLNGILLEFVGQHSSVLSWRLLWAIPVPIIMGTGISASIAIVQERYHSIQWVRVLAASVGIAILFPLFFIAGEPAVFNNFGWPMPKMHKSAYKVARSFVRCSKPTDMVLAPPEIAIPMAGLIGAPSQVAVRSHHLAYLTAQWGPDETKRRNRLFNIVQGKQTSDEAIEWATSEINDRPINRIFLAHEDQQLDSFRRSLRSSNFNHVVLGNWEIWLLHTTAEESTRLQQCLQKAEPL